MEYLPFGASEKKKVQWTFVFEDCHRSCLVEEHLNSNNSPFRFNAKELDATERKINVWETFLAKGRACRAGGNYYYGARYGVYPERSRRDPKFSIWLSVDPLAKMYPEWSSYNYVMQNPVKYIDPDGRSPIYDQNGNFLGVDSNGFKGDIIIMNARDYNYLVDLYGGEDCVLLHNTAKLFGGSFISLNESGKEQALSKIFTDVLENLMILTYLHFMVELFQFTPMTPKKYIKTSNFLPGFIVVIMTLLKQIDIALILV